MPNIQLFTAQTSDANSPAFNAIGAGSGSSYIQESQLTIYGVFGAASAQLEYKARDGNWYSTNDAPFTKAGSYFIKVSSSVPYRLALGGSDEDTSIGADVYNASSAS